MPAARLNANTHLFICPHGIINLMRKLAAFILVFAAALPAQPLQEALRARIGHFQGTVTLYAKNLDTGESVGIRPADPVRTASTIKLPILLAVFRSEERRVGEECRS